MLSVDDGVFVVGVGDFNTGYEAVTILVNLRSDSSFVKFGAKKNHPVGSGWLSSKTGIFLILRYFINLGE